MRLEPRPRPEQILRVSVRLITSSTILHLSADELEHTVTQEQMENPALEVNEQRVCVLCGMPMQGQVCATCGNFAQPGLTMNGASSANYEVAVEPPWSGPLQPYDSDNYGFTDSDSDDEYDPLASIPTGETLAEMLLHQLEALVSPDDALIAEQLVGNLNGRGYLEMSVEEISDYLKVPVERVAYVLDQLQTLEPLGIGARTVRECLLIQLQALSEQEEPHPLAYPLIDRYLDRLGHHSQFAELARELHVSEEEIRQASAYIRTALNPYPAHTYTIDTHYSVYPETGAVYVRPDVIIRKSENGFEVELIEEKRYQFSVSRTYANQASEQASHEVLRYIRQHNDRAKFFIDCMQRRWRTLRRVTELIVECQRAFLEKGVRYLQPLTRAEIATRLHLDEGTVSRTTANKYALLPNGSLIPIADFFDSSLRIKDILRELIHSEGPKRRLSDEDLKHLMEERDIHLARRTITKYREEMGIGSSRER